MKISLENFEIEATSEELNAMAAQRGNANWLLCFMAALTTMNNRTNVGTPTLQAEKGSDNMQMSVEDFNKAYEEALKNAMECDTLSSKEMKLLAEGVEGFLGKSGIDDVSANHAYRVLEVLNSVKLIICDKARALLKKKGKAI